MAGEFWREKPLAALTPQEWEALCDGCGRCTIYPERSAQVPDCLQLHASFTQFHWLPQTCAYRLRAQGAPLPAWHPLVSGRADSVRAAGRVIGAYAVSEAEVEDLEGHLIDDARLEGRFRRR
ncbi:conserved protein of unknown function [Candidatus Methylocalor cossyra]|uniref:Uncharacterized protein n=1 Tax=Candidatus Methylocalor cossyra TaxID=3108543 RepID=A0ABM9NM22_9GAMM